MSEKPTKIILRLRNPFQIDRLWGSDQYVDHTKDEIFKQQPGWQAFYQAISDRDDLGRAGRLLAEIPFRLKPEEILLEEKLAQLPTIQDPNIGPVIIDDYAFNELFFPYCEAMQRKMRQFEYILPDKNLKNAVYKFDKNILQYYSVVAERMRQR